MRPKDDTVELNFSAEAWRGLAMADRLHGFFVAGQHELVITSGTEAIAHSVPRSAHHRGDAWDIRRWYLETRAAEFVRELGELLGDDWIVILEGNHIHAHWAPMYAE